MEPRGRYLAVASDIDVRLAEAITLHFGFRIPSEEYGDHCAFVAYYVTFDNKISFVPTLLEALSDDTLRSRLKQKPKLVSRLGEVRDRRNKLAHGLIGNKLVTGFNPDVGLYVRSATKASGWSDELVSVAELNSWINQANTVRDEVELMVVDLAGKEETAP